MFEGLLLLDKPSGMTSQQALTHLKRRWSLSKIGHAGTLDPLATGLLPCALGEATKFLNFFTQSCKGYAVEAELGYETESFDQEGAITARATPSLLASLSPTTIIQALHNFKGKTLQTPPSYSALKFQGKPRYAYARLGKQIPEPLPREILITEIECDEPLELPHLRFTIDCSAGTYIRSLVRDLGKALGVGATLKSLRRIRFGHFSIKQAYALEEVLSLKELAPCLLPSDALLYRIPAEVHLSPEQLLALSQGGVVQAEIWGESYPPEGFESPPLLARAYGNKPGESLCQGVLEAVNPGSWKVRRWRKTIMAAAP